MDLQSDQSQDQLQGEQLQLERDENNLEQLRIVTASSDGVLRILSYDPNIKNLRFQASTRNFDCMTTCVCWAEGMQLKNGFKSLETSTLSSQFFGGYEDSFVRKYSANRAPIAAMSLSDSKAKKVIPWRM